MEKVIDTKVKINLQLSLRTRKINSRYFKNYRLAIKNKNKAN